MKNFIEKVKELARWGWFKDVETIGAGLLVLWMLVTIANRWG